jgi:hypothetical protein
MDGFRWTRASHVAALVAAAIACLVVGMLAGVLASGGHPHSVLQVITDPAPASAHDLQPKSQNKPALPTQFPTAVTSTTIITAPARTVTMPAQTVTETETQTVTDPAPTTTPQTTSP